MSDLSGQDHRALLPKTKHALGASAPEPQADERNPGIGATEKHQSQDAASQDVEVPIELSDAPQPASGEGISDWAGSQGEVIEVLDKPDVSREEERLAKIAAETRRLPTLWPKQHYGKPDYIKMYVWGEWLDCFDEMFKDDDSEDEESVHEEDPRQPAALEVQFLDQEVIEELELNMASTEEKEFFLEPFEVAIDSGAGEHVTSGEDVPGYAIEPSRGSKVGQNFITAGKTKIPNKGQVHLNLRAGERVKGKGNDIKTIFQVADIKRPLWSVSKICDAGFTVKFDRDAAVVLDSKGKECVRFERRGGLYVAKLMLRNPKYKNADEGFQRPGK